MPRYIKMRCLKCGEQRERHCNAKKCHCGGALVNVTGDSECCPTCGKPFKTQSPVRFCLKCKKPILRGHKFRCVNIEGNVTTVEHRCCSDPNSYKPDGDRNGAV